MARKRFIRLNPTDRDFFANLRQLNGWDRETLRTHAAWSVCVKGSIEVPDRIILPLPLALGGKADRLILDYGNLTQDTGAHRETVLLANVAYVDYILPDSV